MNANKNDRPTPRERLERFGANQLTDRELLSVLLGGSRAQGSDSARQTAGRLLDTIGNLQRIERMSMQTLSSIPGMGLAKAARVKAAIELGRRQLIRKPDETIHFDSSQRVYDIYAPRLNAKDNEVFLAALINSRLRWIGDLQLAQGALFECVVKPRDIFAAILREAPAAVIFVHNHPSGDPSPSNADARLTRRLVKAGELLGVSVLDHIIVGKGAYYSFSDAGELHGRDGKKRFTIEKSSKNQTGSSMLVAPKPDDSDVFPDIWCMHDMDIFGSGDDFDK